MRSVFVFLTLLCATKAFAADQYQIIPLYSVANPGRPQVPASRIKDICSKAADRLVAVLKAMLQKHPFFSGLVSVISFLGVKGMVRNAIQNYIMKDLADAVDPKS